MTNPIGSGTANLSINVPLDERRLWGRLAFLAIERGEARSVGDYERKILAKGLEASDPQAAARLREIRSRYYATTLAVLLTLGSISSWFSASSGEAARRTSSTVRIVRVVRAVRGRLGEYEMEAVV
jgi:hypothetical protein